MIFFKRKAARIKELEGLLFDMEKRAIEAEQFERIAAGKLSEWVQKHDDLLIQYKTLQKTFL